MTKRIALVLSVLAAATLTSCNGGGDSALPPETINAVAVPDAAEPVTNTPAPLGPVVAHVSNIVEGESAFVGSTKATIGQQIHLNEHFYTGPGTKMEIMLEDGGATIWLDQLTDPSFFKSAQCFWIRLTKGTMAVTNKDPMCAEAGRTKSNQHSYVLYQADGETTTIAVFEGEVTTITPPGYTVSTGQILTVQNGETSGPQPMDQDTINRLQAWIPRIIL